MNDQDKTETMEQPEGSGPGSGEEPRRLLRSRDDRMIAGVAGGLAEYFAIDPVIVRIGFAISLFFGGLGFFVYAALALFVPTRGDTGEVEDAPIERSRMLAIGAGVGLIVLAASWGFFDAGWGPFGNGWWIAWPLAIVGAGAGVYYLMNREGRRIAPRLGGPGRVLLGVVLTIGAIAALGSIAVASAWAGATGNGEAVAAALIGMGVLLVIAAFRGGARWLIAPALALALPLGAVAAADIHFSEGVGEREYRPATQVQIPEDGYELGIGRLVVDLRSLNWTDQTELELDVDLGVGEAVIAVPEDVCVTADLDAGAGELNVAGNDSDGWDVQVDTGPPSGSAPRLDLNGEVDAGVIRVVNDDDYDLDEHHFGPNRDGIADDELRDRMEAACAA